MPAGIEPVIGPPRPRGCSVIAWLTLDAIASVSRIAWVSERFSTISLSSVIAKRTDTSAMVVPLDRRPWRPRAARAGPRWTRPEGAACPVGMPAAGRGDLLHDPRRARPHASDPPSGGGPALGR